MGDMYQHAQRMDVLTVLPSHVECNYYMQCAITKVAEEVAATMPLPGKISIRYSEGSSMAHIPKYSFTTIIVPASEIIKKLEEKKYELVIKLFDLAIPAADDKNLGYFY
jgi:hypothetical protein